MFVLCAATLSYAQKGTIRGGVIDNATGEALIGVTVVIEGTTTGGVTDLEGKFEIKAEPGTYSLQVTYISYTSMTIQSVEVVANQVTTLADIRLSENVEQLSEIVVTAEALKNSEEALFTVKMKSTNLLDGISAASFKKIGDSDVAAAVKRVPGVSVEGGKYVYVRGIGDRYTKSTLNGVDIPGLDPDRNTVQMDLFPTSLIDNIVVVKSFTSELPADFTGGIVNLDTKSFPDEKALSVSISLGYNPSMHFNNSYLTYTGGKTDFLGFDDGTRDIPTGKSTNIPRYIDVVGNVNSSKAQEFRSILESFNPQMAAMREKSFMDFGMGVNYGNQFSKGVNTIGYNFSLVYSNTTEFYENAQYGRYIKGESSLYEMKVTEFQQGDYGVNNVSLSAMGGIALKRNNSRYKLNLLHTQNGESKTGVFDFENSDLGANFNSFQHNLEYTQRSLSNMLINGTHFLGDSKWQIDWRLSPTISNIEDPDIRFTRYRDDNGNLTISSESGYPTRIWRYLQELNLVGKTDVTRDYTFLRNEAKLKFGVSYAYKQRDFEIQNFQIVPQDVDVTGNPDELFLPENLWGTNPDGVTGVRYEPSFIPNNTNKFDASVSNAAVYASNEFRITRNLKSILGLRVENYVQLYTGLNQQRVSLNDKEVIDDLDFFPSVNLIYSLSETQNLRFSFSGTIARPSFKEASFAEILDPLTGRTFIGGFNIDKDEFGNTVWDGNLQATHIDNFDLRWELFQKKGQTVAVSAFYKAFDKPIEIVQFVQAPNNFQPRNVGNGKVYGIEVELRKNLGFVSSVLEEFSLNTNVTVTESSIEMSNTEYQARLTKARDGETIKNTRSMAGQAPYIVNAGLSYKGEKNGLDVGVFYNVQGETLAYVGISDRPDVYAVPFHSVNMSINKSFGVEEKLQLGLTVANMLNDNRELVYKSFNASNQYFSKLSPGSSFNLKVGYKF